ncbi:aldolase [Pseudoalteromonas rubra]|uniref:Aldolase n=1 Tax=Pseudoalteromonas rubra TaxID=43658 RepID=A0A5S3WR74_9GAMM|nr:aldolase/citrate lyase family protein [Pseudoalteromonas rubra]TMP31440.1 aldolase [Pseudoalteromonas rubra]TMP34525.1 aldolase [Pseudoalteromonas rubra]
MIKTFILENDPAKIELYDLAGVSRIFVDLEINGKVARQGGMDTVISRHTVEDVVKARAVIKKGELLVRVNPIFDGSKQEVDSVIDAGADVVMLPMFTHADEVRTFVELVGGRAKVSLLLETSQAFCRADEILEVEGIDEVHIGLNDLHLSMGLDFMFELMALGQVELLAQKLNRKSIPFGVGGVAKMKEGELDGAIILKEHVRIGSTAVILSRTFKADGQVRMDEVKHNLDELQHVYSQAQELTTEALVHNKALLDKKVQQISAKIRSKKRKA